MKLDHERGRARPSAVPGGLRGALVAACALAAACSAARRGTECDPGLSEVCESPCGVGTRECGEGGEWGPCMPWGDVQCLPGQSGSCELGEGEPPGRWTCSEDCVVGPCEVGCEPGDRVECEGPCGPGERRCGDDGVWRPCVEYFVPECQPGEVESCDGRGHRRCTDSCAFGPCEEPAPCEPGEEAVCNLCGLQRCLDDGRWGPCDAECFPGEAELCSEGDGDYCGTAVRWCTATCTWGECIEVLNPPDIPDSF